MQGYEHLWEDEEDGQIVGEVKEMSVFTINVNF